MPKLEKWLVVSKMVPVLDSETLKEVVDLGAQIGGGWCEVHQHIHINPKNKEKIEEVLINKGYKICAPSDESVFHPEEEIIKKKQCNHE